MPTFDYSKMVSAADRLLTLFGLQCVLRYNTEAVVTAVPGVTPEPWDNEDATTEASDTSTGQMAFVPYAESMTGVNVRDYYHHNQVHAGFQLCFIKGGDIDKRPTLESSIEHPTEGILQVVALDIYSPGGVDVLYVLGVTT